MRVLIVHNTYQRAGGEDVVVAMEAAMLRRAGHEVHLELVSNDSIAGFSDKVRTLLRTPYDRSRAAWMDGLLERTGAELVHVHNFFPLLTPAIHEAAARRGVAVVQTLHNYRLICAAATLLRDGTVCEKCVTGSTVNAVVHRCYRGSVAGSAAIVAMQSRAVRRGTWHKSVHRFIALTDFARGKFIEGGLPADRIAVKPNAIDWMPPPGEGARRGALFVGRLSPEKGVPTLLRSWQQVRDMPLTIVGDGPERAALEAKAPASVTFLGQLGPDAVRAQMLEAQCLIVPSIWYEGFPMTIVEAFSAGLPVIASRIGSLAEIVREGVVGRQFAPGDSTGLAKTINELAATPAALTAMGEAARREYEDSYTPTQGLQALEAIYQAALGEAARSR